MNRFKNTLNHEHSGIGGLYFLVTSALCAMIVFTVVSLSWSSQVIAMADNFGHIVALNTTVYNYVGKEAPHTVRTNPKIPIKSTGGLYDPLADFNKMIRDAGIATTNSTKVEVIWTGTKSYLQFGSFKTTLGDVITPHRQQSAIENN